MKKYLYVIFALFFALQACKDDEASTNSSGSGGLPKVTLQCSVSSVRCQSFVLSGLCTEGKDSVLASGMQYKQLKDSTWKTVALTNDSVLVSDNISEGKVYQYRFYATTSKNTYYSEQKQFTTDSIYVAGDYYYLSDSIKGVVFEVDNTGKHGSFISLNEAYIEGYVASSWCSSKGSGWALPSKAQLDLVYNELSTLNAGLKLLAATELATENDKNYWSNATYCLNGMYAVNLVTDAKTVLVNWKSAYVRAVYSF